MATLYDDILNHLVDLELIGGSTGWTDAVGWIPPTPDQIIAIFETPGDVPEIAPEGSDETQYDLPGFQIRGRGAEYGYAALRAKMGQIYRALHGADIIPTTGDPVYVYVYAVQSGPLPLGMDDNSRPEMTWNFRCMREREST